MYLSQHLRRLLLLSSLSITLAAAPAIAHATTIDSSTESGEETVIISTPAEETTTEAYENNQLETYDTDSTESDSNNPDSNNQDSTESTTEETTEKNEATEPSTEEPVTDTTAKIRKSVTFKGYTLYSLKYIKGRKITLNISANSDAKLTYTSSKKSVATVSSSGKMTLKGPGTCKITVTSPKTDSYKKKTVTITVKVWRKAKNLKFSASYKKSIFYKRLTQLHLFSNKRNNILSVAKSQIGYHESSSASSLVGLSSSGGNYTEFGRFYGYNGVPWCAIFVNWVARANRISLSVIPKECAVRNYYSFFRKRGRTYSWAKVRKGKYKPKKGDIIFYSNQRGATTHHIGYVQSVTYTKTTVKIITVEGNQDDAVRKVTMRMKRSSKSGYVNNHYITAFASPKY